MMNYVSCNRVAVLLLSLSLSLASDSAEISNDFFNTSFLISVVFIVTDCTVSNAQFNRLLVTMISIIHDFRFLNSK